MSSQSEWEALRVRYQTPPGREDPTARQRRLANQRQAQTRLQNRQIARRLQLQHEMVEAGDISQVAITQTEAAVLARRYAPAVGETAAQRRLRLRNRGRAERRLQDRAAARRADRQATFAANRAGMAGGGGLAQADPPSYGQLAAAVLNLSLTQERFQSTETTDAVPPHTGYAAITRQTPSGAFPSYAQLAQALRNLTPEQPGVDEASPGFPTYAQLNAALRNLSPDLPIQEEPSPGIPTYSQLAEALRNLTPVVAIPGEEVISIVGINTVQTSSAQPPRRRRVLRNSALKSLDDFEPLPRHELPPMNVRCGYCGSMRWPYELPNACCVGGAAKLAPAEQPPDRVRQLFETPAFLAKIRGYNSAFAFTSTGAKEDRAINRGNAPYTFRVNGSMHHRIGQLLPPGDANPSFAQIYVYDGSTEQQVALRGGIASGLNPVVLGELQEILYAINPLAQVYKSARDSVEASQEMCLVLFDNPRVDPRRYNRAIMIDGGPTASHRDVILRYRSGGLRRIFETHPLYDPLQYPLLYLRGEIGWSQYAQYVDGVERYGNTKLKLREHCAYRLYIKHSDVEYSLLHRAGRLMQQWCVDQAAKIVDQRLFYQRRLNTQQLYRRDLFCGVRDLMLGDHALLNAAPDLRDTGTHIILSAKFPGGVRYMRQQYYDSMAVVRQFGKPDLFITITTNPNWKEIQDNLLPGQTASDRPDIVARVFRMKFKEILDDIVDRRIFGEVQAYMTAADYDKFVCAEIPDRDRFPELYETVTTCMIHGPCGDGIDSPCVGEDGKCSKRFPKEFVEETRVDGDGYPLYRRRRPGPVDSTNPERGMRPSSARFVRRRIRNPRRNGPKTRREAVVVDNRWVVPYNPYLCQKYNCHVNVEICSTVQSVKYLYKYVYKGQDRATVVLRPRRQPGQAATQNQGNAPKEPIDEIQQYLDARYLSPPEACWIIFKYEMQQKSHHVHRLPVHEESKQLVHYSTTARLEDVLALNEFTKLTAFFDLCCQDSAIGDTARELLYHEVPIHFVWKKVGRRNRWVPRKNGGEKAIKRMISVSPRDTNRFYIRLLLCYRRGPTSFDDLRTVDGEVRETFKAAALALGLLESDEDNHQCLLEASTFDMPRQLRHLFAVLLVYCEPSDPGELWTTHIAALSEDHLRAEVEAHNCRARNALRAGDVIHDTAAIDHDSVVYRRALYLTLHDVNSHLISNGQDIPTYHDSLPQFEHFRDVETPADVNARNRNRLLENETSYDERQLEQCTRTVDDLNSDQRLVFDEVMAAVLPDGVAASEPHRSGKLFFLDGPGGTGKSFLLEKLLGAVRHAGASRLPWLEVVSLLNSSLGGELPILPSAYLWILMRPLRATLGYAPQKRNY